MKLGIENLKILFTGILNFATSVGETLKDGAQFEDLFVLIKQWPNLNIIIAQAPVGWAELKDLDPLESQELAEYISIQFDIPNDQVEQKIETGIRLASKWYFQYNNTVMLFEDTKDWAKTLKQAA